MAAVDEYIVCVFIRMVRNSQPGFNHVIDWTGKSAHMQLTGDAKIWYAHDAANDPIIK